MRILAAAAIATLAESERAWPPPTFRHAGKYPSDKVGGTAFLDHPMVIAGVEQAVSDAAARDWVLSPDTVQSPIFDSAGMLLSQACEPHNCGDHTWTILIHIETGATDVCYHDAPGGGLTSRAGPGAGTDGDTAGLCPSE